MSPPLPAKPAAPEEPLVLEPVGASRTNRSMLAVSAVVMLVVLGLARWVEPDARGYGTHERLGLPPCSFLTVTGVPCPSCGMTTSFAYVVRGEIAAAARTNLAGCMLALGLFIAIPWCVASAAAGRTLGLRSPERAIVAVVLVLVGIGLAGWTVRVLF